MKSLFWSELKNVLLPLTIFNLLLLFGAGYQKSFTLFVMGGVQSMIFIVWLYRRSSWYLNLPISRLKLAGFITLQNLALFAIQATFSLVTYLILSRFYPMEFKAMSFDAVKWSFILGLILFAVITMLTPIFVHQQREVFSRQWWFSRKVILTYGTIGTLLFIAYKSDLQNEPFAWGLLGISILAFMTYYFFQSVLMPKAHLKRIARVAFLTPPIALVVAYFTFAALVNLLPASTPWAGYSAYLLGRMPAYVSIERAVDIFKNSQAWSTPLLTRNALEIGARVSEEDWQKRTSLCSSSRCFDLSADITDLSKSSPNQVEDRFFTLMTKCKFTSSDNGAGRVQCDHWPMDLSNLNRFLAKMKDNGRLENWLNGNDPRKQIIAILGFNEDQETLPQIRKLASHSDPQVSLAATQMVAAVESIKAMKLDCEQKDKYSRACDRRQIGSAAYFR
jgi:hypothetical protein